VNDVALVTVPPPVVSVIAPVVAPVGTVTTSIVVPVRVQPETPTPLNFKEVIPIKFVPVIVTDVPTGPDVGVNDVIVGAR